MADMDVSTQTLDALVDGELPPAEMERVARLLADRPELEAYVVQQEKLRAQLRMNDVISAPVPQRLLDTVHNTPISWRWRLQQWTSARALAPAAAALTCGLVLGIILRPESDIATINGALVARGALAVALDTKLASAAYDGQGVRIGISFRNRAGQDCRTFSSDQTAGLACHNGGEWSVATLVSSSPEQSSGYRMAGSEMPEAVRRAVESQIDGAPYGAGAEARAKARGWAGK